MHENIEMRGREVKESTC